MQLSTKHSLLLLASIASSVAGPLAKRDPCDGVNAEPELYKEYGTEECPPKNVDENHHCPFKMLAERPQPGHSDCAKFCQIRTEFYYGQEQPFANTYCHGPLTCTISETKTRTITLGGGANLNGKISDALTVGISGTVSFADATAFARSYAMKLEPGQCGYFTFVPVLHGTCGTLTESPGLDIGLDPGGGTERLCNAFESLYKTTENYCIEQLRRHDDGTVDGETIFVRTDCGTRKPLPKDQQDPVYQKPNVPLPRALMEAYATTFEQHSTGDIKAEVKCSGGSGSGPLEACRGLADQQADISPEWTIPAGEKGWKNWFGDYPSDTHDPGCSYYMEFLEDLDPEKCPMKTQGVAAIIEDINDACREQGVFGSVTLGGDCPVRLTTEKRSWDPDEGRPAK